jgi:hypothetical protein
MGKVGLGDKWIGMWGWEKFESGVTERVGAKMQKGGNEAPAPAGMRSILEIRGSGIEKTKFARKDAKR